MPVTKITRPTLILLAGSASLLPLSHSIIVAALPYIRESLQISIFSSATMLSAFPFGLGLSQLLYGPRVDRYGVKQVFAFGTVLLVIASLASYFASSNIASLTVLHFLQGAGVAAVILSYRVIFRQLAEQDTNKLTRYYSLEGIVCTSSSALAPSIATAFIIYLSWNNLYLLTASLAALFAIGYWYFVFQIPTASVPSQTKERIDFSLLLGNPKFRNYLLLAATPCAWSYIYAVGYPLSLKSIFQVNDYLYSLLITINLLGASAILFLNIYLTKYFRTSSILQTCLVLVVALSGTMIFIVATVAPSLTIFASLFFLMNSLVSITYVNSMTLALRACDESSVGRATALYGFLCYIFGFISGTLSGFVLDLPYDDLLSFLVWLLTFSTFMMILCYLVVKRDPEETASSH